MTRLRLVYAFAATALALTAPCGFVSAAESMPWQLQADALVQKNEAQAGFWRLVQDSVVIARAKFELTPRDRKRLTPEITEYIPLRLSITEVYLGSIGSTAEVLYSPSYNSVPPEYVLNNIGIDVIVFLTLFDGNGSENLYFPGYSSDEMIKYSAETEKYIREIISKQDRIAAEIDQRFRRDKPPFDARVADLIEKLLDPTTVQEAKQSFFSLSPAAMPAVVKHMDDRRLLADPHVELLAAPGDFEGVVHHSPPTVVDFLSVVLSEKTGGVFSWTYGGGPEPLRERAVHYWKVWLGRAIGL